MHVYVEVRKRTFSNPCVTKMDETSLKSRLYAAIGLTAIAMGLRNATVRRLKVPDLTTTVLTAHANWIGRGFITRGR
jgi:hypothetical protein